LSACRLRISDCETGNPPEGWESEGQTWDPPAGWGVRRTNCGFLKRKVTGDRERRSDDRVSKFLLYLRLENLAGEIKDLILLFNKLHETSSGIT
jgi:hypothetical protein